MDEDAIGEVVARRSGSRKGGLAEPCSLKIARRVDGIVLLRSVDVSGRPTMTAELTPAGQGARGAAGTRQPDVLMDTVALLKVDGVQRSIPASWGDPQARTRPSRMAAMQERPGRWWTKIARLAGLRRHRAFRRACVYLLELRGVTDREDFLRRLARFRTEQRRKKDLIGFLNEAGLTVPGEPLTWEDLVAACPLKQRRRGECGSEGAGLALWFEYSELDEPESEAWDDDDDDIPF